MATPRTMKAVQYDKYGGGAEGLKHVEVPVPSPKKGEVLLKMEAASINPIDWKIQKGMLRPFLPGKFPFTPVGDLAGEVVQVGGGVTNIKPGDKVVSISFPSGGGFAEYAVAPAALTVARPPEVSAVDGACLPAAASSALQLLKATGVSFDSTSNATGPKNVLVTAASGGVGHYAVQLAKLAGRTRYDAVANCAAGVSWPALKAVLADEGGTAADVTPGVRAALTSLLQKVTFAKKRLAPLMLTPKREEMEWLVDLARQGSSGRWWTRGTR
ncbi:hypothetical protein ACQ4PT_043870 [Festuca glaucescens]